jgi:tripeptidyl-peptidase-1
MKVFVLAILTGLTACASAAPAPVPHAVQEKRSTQIGKWACRDIKVNRIAIIPMSIGLTQRNLNNGYDFLMEVFHLESPNYGKHYSMNKEEMVPSS